MALNNNSPEMAVKEMLSILSSTTTGDQGKIDLYDKFARQFQEAEVSLFSFDVRQNMSDLARVLLRDIMSANPEVCQGALATMCVCLHDSDIVRALSDDEAREILNILHGCILKTQNKSCCTRALWCLGKQNIPTHVVSKQVSELVQALEHAAEMWGGQSVTVEHELVNTIDRLAEQAPTEMGETASRWGKLLVALVCHSAVKVRERVLVVMETTSRLIKKQRKDFSTAVLPMVKTKVIPEMKKLFAGKQELFVLKSWSLLVDLFGEELHHGAHINALLQVAELGFKSTQKEVKMAAFRAWQQLIDNFAINPAILSDPKRIKLIMQVFKLNNANQEEVALIKMRVWWHFIWLLGSKISANFDLVAVPFIQFCCGTTKQGEQSKGQTPRRVPTINSPGTPHMQLPTPSSHWPVFESLQQHGCEALALFLASPPAAMEHDFKLDILMAEVVTGPSFFIKHASMFITTATELFTSLGKDVSESVILHVWQCLVTHLKNAIDSPVKLDVRETLHTLLLQFQIMVLSRVVNSSLCLKVFEQLSQLPRKLLSSSAYSMPGQEMNSTPALFLISLLLTPVLLHSCGHSATYLDLFTQLLSCDQAVGTLDFVESVAEKIQGGLVGTTGADTDEAGLKLWTALAHSLQEYLNKTNEVNQGDAIDPKFTCCVQMVVLPMKHVSQMSQHTLKSVQKTWIDLYKTVDRLTAMVTNAEANVICEEVSQKILEQLKITEANVTEVDWLVSSCHTMVSCLDFSSLVNQSMFTLGSPSPKKMAKKRNKALHNLHSLVQVLEALQNQALQLAMDTTKKPGPVGHQGMLNQLVDIFSTLFTHVTPSHLIYNLIGQLARPIGNLFTESSQKSSKVFNNAFQQKLEKLWQDITTAVQSRYTSLYDSQFLSMMAPLLEGTLVHPRRQIKNAAITMWTSTFATTPSLEYPESLKLVLTKVKEKSHIQLPGWVAMETSVVQETPQSQMSQMDQSQMPEARLPGMPSPHKIHGSLLNKAVSPNVKMSPKRTVPSPKATSAKKKVLDFYDNDKDFVVIAPPPKKKMVLTAHQKEVLKERKDLPAMYNSLELSMDVSLMAAHFTTDTQMDSSCHDDTPTPTTQPFSLFGSAISPSDAATKIVSDKKEETEKKKAEKKSSRGKKDGSQESKSPSLLDETSQTRRRSVRFMDNATTSSPAETTNSTSKTKTPNKKAASQTEKSDNLLKGGQKSKRGGKDGEKSSNESNNSSRLSSGDDSVVVIGDSEEQDMETQPPDGEKTGSVSDSSVGSSQKEGVTKGKVGGVSMGEADVDMKVDAGAESQVESLPQNVLGLPEVTSLSSSTNSSSKAASSPDLLTASSDKLSSQKKSTAPSDESSTQKSSNTDGSKSSNDNLAKEKGVRSPCKDGKQATEQASSQPLLSWAQKLDELSQSPKVNISSLRKSFSQDDPKVCSPHKSPSGKTKKKQTKENESKGALDKWIIRSPSKKVDLSNRLNNDAIVASVLSGTVVEETQSPTKFDKIEKSFKSSLSSVMETPPKNVLETLSSSIGNSNRKLFGSQSSNGDEVFDMVEDSNIVPGSPDSKSCSGKTGTPILKIRKLTEEEIRRYSPKKMPETDSVISILQSSASQKLKDASFLSKDESSHEHDDFSDLTPLEKTEFDASSKTLSDTDQALLQISNSQSSAMKGGEPTGGKKGQSQVKKQDSEQSSQNLFSQESTVGESVVDTQHDSFVLNSVETLKETSDSTSSVSQQLFSEIPNVSQISESQLSGMGSENAGSESSFDITAAETLNGDIMTPRRNRKRKQVTPKKFSPEDIRSPKRKKVSENGSAKKSGQKTTNKKKEKNDETDMSPVKKISNSPSVKVQETEIKSTQNSESSQSSVDSSGQCTIIEVPEKKSKPVRKVSLTLKKDEEKMPKRGSRKDSKGSEDNCDKDRIEEQEKVVEKNDMLDEIKDDDKVLARKGSVEVKTKKNSEKLNDDLEEKTSSGKAVEKISSGKAVEKLSGKKLSGSDKDESNRESRKTARPVRRSTVKQKKQRDESNEQKDNTNVLVNYGNSNLDVNDSEERMEVDSQDLYRKVAKDGHVDSGSDTKGKTKLNDVVEHTDSATGNSDSCSKDIIKDASKADTLETEKDAAISKKEENVTEDISIISEDSDDEQPLIVLTRSKKKDSAKRKGGQSLENKEEVDHSKSDKKVNTRLRVVAKGKTSPQAKKSVNLAIKRSRRSAEKNASENGEDVDQGEKHGETSNDVIESKNENKMSDTIATCNKDNSDIIDLVSLSDDDGYKEKTLDKFKENVLKSLNLAGQEGLEITPKKGYEGFKTRSALLVRNSDSKLFIGQRKFARRQGVARRSILKPASVGGTSEDADSPKRMEFHPITISRIYSPTASPSASILKKRRLSGEPQVAETCSPPSKQRRVSFAEPLTETDNPALEAIRAEVQRPMSPLASKAKNGSTPVGSLTATKLFSDSQSQSSLGSPVSNTYQSSANTQLDATEPIFPELRDCTQSVEKILPQLTSSMWSRGLGQLVRARNIHTIGDLAQLTEADIDNLPVRAPKVTTVKQVLEKYLQAQKLKTGRLEDKSEDKLEDKSAQQENTAEPDDDLEKGEAMDLDSNKDLGAEKVEQQEIPTNDDKEEAEETKSTEKMSEDVAKNDDLYSIDVEKMLASSNTLLDEVNRLSQSIDQSGSPDQSCDQATSQSSSSLGKKGGKVSSEGGGQEMIDRLQELAQLCHTEEVRSLRTDQLFQAHQHLADIQAAIVSSLRSRCHSPTS